MDINVNIKAPELADALKDIAIALSAIANLSGGPMAEPAATPVTEKPPAKETELKPADLKKKKIADEIVALGGTPPEKGSVAKFEEALEKAKAAKAEEDGGEGEQEPGGESEGETTEDGEDVFLDDVRTLAYAVIRKNPDNENKGKMALQGCLKQVKAKKVSEATPKQLNALVPLLEEYLGKSLAEVLAEAE